MSAVLAARRLAGAVRRWAFPTPVVVARRRLEAAASGRGRVEGPLRLLDYELEFGDAAPLVPQWNDIFVRETLALDIGAERPRILDCGANVGLATLYFKRRWPDARVTAFEADPVICETLRRNLQRNRASDVDVVCGAVWTAAAPVRFARDGADSGAIESVGGPPRVRETITVDGVRLRDWIAAEPIDLLKLDIEGAELAVLEDCRDVLDRVKALHIEIHELRANRRMLPDCLLLLERAGFTYALDDLFPVRWRHEGRASGPFAHGVPAWVILARAWRERAV
jgi:FkbM family methyltransferase